jgi:hypothetical protein
MNVTSYFLGLSESLYYGPSNTVREESGVMYWRLGDRSYQNQHSWLKTMATSWIEQHLYWSQFLSFLENTEMLRRYVLQKSDVKDCVCVD